MPNQVRLTYCLEADAGLCWCVVVQGHPDVEDCVLDPSQAVSCEMEACETANQSSYATKPLPPAKTDVISRVFKWRRSHSIDNVTACDGVVEKPVMNPMPKTTTDNQGIHGDSWTDIYELIEDS